MPQYPVFRQLEKGGFQRAGQISPVNMKEDVSMPDPSKVAEKVASAVKTILGGTYEGKLFFSDQDPTINLSGDEIVADNMYKLRNLVNEQVKDVYFYNNAKEDK